MATLQEKPESLSQSAGLQDVWRMAPLDLSESELSDLNDIFSFVHNLSGTLKKLLECEAEASRQVVEHLFSSGGKGVRPALFYLSSRLCGYSGDCLETMAAVCEYVHGASILHDDVVDKSELRRGKATANTLWSDKHSVLVGDLIYARASELMAQTGNLQVVEAFARAIRRMSEGELLQMDHAFNLEITHETYYRIIHYKTAALLEAITFSAAALAKKEVELCERMQRFGYFTGMAFQIIDDTIDYSESGSLAGKAALSDLREGKVTLPLIMALQKESGVDTKRLVNDQGFTDPSYLQKLIAKHKTVEACLAVAKDMTQKATESLNDFPDSKEKKMLLQVVQTLLYRKF
jgi:octaprenyl-diphosphate synthase